MHSVYFLLYLHGKHNSKYFIYDMWLNKISNTQVCEGLSCKDRKCFKFK